MQIKERIVRHYRLCMMKHNPKKYADMLYYDKFGKRIDWDNPQTLNEKINYLAFSPKSEKWDTFADKFRVREYVSEKGCSDILVPLLACWNNADEITFDSIEAPFVIKLNNGYGDITFVHDKREVSIDDIKGYYRAQLEKRFGLRTAEPHYTRIKPRIIAERMLLPDSGSLIDYKIWCINGTPKFIFTVSNRNHVTHNGDFALYDLNWTNRNDLLSPPFRSEHPVPEPQKLVDMINYARILSDGMPEVRIDFYEINGKIYFGEMTMTSAGGRMEYFTDEFQLSIGEEIQL